MSAALGMHTAARRAPAAWDGPLLLVVFVLLGLGLVMVGSASVSMADRQLGTPFFYLTRQLMTLGIGVLLGFVALRMPLEIWQRLGLPMLIVATALLAIVLIPGLGRTANGSTRWLALGPLSFQVSEFAKLAAVVYVAGYLVRHEEAVRSTFGGFLKPLALMAVPMLLLLLEPDFGAAVVILATVMGMLFLGGVRLSLFGALVVAAGGLLAFLAVSSPYRMERLTTFTNPWADPFNSGYQLTQALIAFGRGEWFGVGLGGSVQKLFYMPEAHTDFLFAVLAEELGLIGVMAVILLFAYLAWRGFAIGRRASRAGLTFGGHLAFGITLWLAIQAFVNIGVNMGALPTKGLTLPLMSYGRSSLLVVCIAIALLLRVDYEVRRLDGGVRR
ncbi:MAG: putative lipid II flippase FtsW [Gammaproteobacteria bacterium]|nr:putative lipid II flippase FtsW [Gammaproteobacteria bacterium]